MNAQIKQMNGLQLMRSMAKREIPLPNIAEIIPMLDGTASRGEMTIRVRADDRHLNSNEVIHGGFAATVLDTAMACAIHTMLNENSSVCTIDLNVKFLKSIPKGIDLFVEGKVNEITRNIGFASGILRDESGTVYVNASTSCMLLTNNL